MLKLGKEGVAVNGFIDRVDMSLDGKEAYVIDYKLSRRDLNKKIKQGIEVQLPIYMLAVERLLGLTVRGGELRFLEPGEKAGLESERARALMAETEATVVRAAGELKKGNLAVNPKTCDHCDFESVCRFEKWKLIYHEVDTRG